jgi:preprotein translocase subunit SecB
VSQQPSLPTTGYMLERVYFSHLSLRVVQNVPNLPEDEGQIGFGWDWRIVAERLFEVSLQVSIDPTKARLEEVRLTICGLFRIPEGQPQVALDSFLRIHGPAHLMPYVRETLSSLTGRGFYGAFYLPPVNVIELMKDMKPEKATGAEQLRQGTTLLPAASGVS